MLREIIARLKLMSAIGASLAAGPAATIVGDINMMLENLISTGMLVGIEQNTLRRRT